MSKDSNKKAPEEAVRAEQNKEMAREERSSLFLSRNLLDCDANARCDTSKKPCGQYFAEID